MGYNLFKCRYSNLHKKRAYMQLIGHISPDKWCQVLYSADPRDDLSGIAWLLNSGLKATLTQAYSIRKELFLGTYFSVYSELPYWGAGLCDGPDGVHVGWVVLSTPSAHRPRDQVTDPISPDLWSDFYSSAGSFATWARPVTTSTSSTKLCAASRHSFCCLGQPESCSA